MSSERRSVGLVWLGQSGYAIDAPDGAVCLLDPYLSNWAFDDLGTPRAVPPVLDPADVVADAVVVTHWHHDHLDLPACRVIAERNPHACFIGPPSIAPRLCGWGLARERILPLKRGSTAEWAGFTVHGGFARHEVAGFLTEDAVSIIIEVAGISIFVSGDTEYDARVLADARKRRPFDVGLFVINGSGGNMNALEAALMAHQLTPSLAIPTHYGMWPSEYYGPDATLDPRVFQETCAALGGPPTRALELHERVEFAIDPPVTRPG